MTRSPRTYNQYCSLARALDIVGERWTLLIVRELLSGPKRFKDLQQALAGIGANLLSTRLKEMERNGLVVKGVLPPPGVASVYDLTEHGGDLEETLMALVRWGIPLLAEPQRPGELFMPHWLLQGMLSAFNAMEAAGVSETYEFHVNHEIFHATVQEGKASGDMGKGYRPVLVWVSDSENFMALAFRRMTAEQAVVKGLVVAGDAEVLKRALRMFDPTQIPRQIPGMN